MKRHDEDLWDFRSDPIFGDKDNASKDSSSDTPSNPSAEDTADSDYNNYKEEFVDILRTSTAKDSSLDNMTFVMKDGKASFIDNSLLSPSDEEKTANAPAQNPAPAPKEPNKSHSADKPSKEALKVEPKEKPQPKAPEKATEEKPEPKPSPAMAEPEITKPESTNIEVPNNSTQEKVPSKSDTFSEADSQKTAEEPIPTEEPVSKPVTASAEEHKEDNKEPFFETSKETTAPSSLFSEKKKLSDNNQNTDEKSPDKNSKGKKESPSQKAHKPTKANENTSPDEDNKDKKRKVPATDSDFIFAKPHSKKKSHSHHSHHRTSNSHSSTTSSDLPTDNVDDYVFSRYRKKSSHHHHKGKSSRTDYMRTPDNESTTVVCSTTASHFRTRRTDRDRKWNKRPMWQKLLIILGWIMGVLLALLLIALILFLVFSRIGIKDMTDYDDAKINAPHFESVNVQIEDEGKIQIYNGKKYRLNTDIANILCIGVDKHNIYENESTDEYSSLSDNGQSDALFLVALNTNTGKTTVLSIPRDTMTNINVYDKNGKFLKTDTLQICQAYAYGDGQEGSCHNTKDAVSRLFYQFPIQTYFAMDLSAIAPINDTLGGVKVTMIDNSFYDIYNIHHEKGESVLLLGDNARKYVQQRDVNQLESTTNRLARQINYLKAFSSKALEKTKKDITTPVNLFNVISSNSISDLDVYRISALAKCLIENGVTKLEFKTIPGTLQSDGKYAQYIIDKERFYELFLETYYVPVD